MTPPLKPWERTAQNRPCNTVHWNQWFGNVSGQNNSRSMVHPSEIIGSVPSTSATNQNVFPPPLPPRPGEQNSFSRYNSFPFNNFSAFNNYSSPYYNPMNTGYGFGNRFGYGNDLYSSIADSSFVRLAEESSRPAFQSIQSIVQAVASVSMMLESTHHAVYSSFRAVLGVAEHFSRLRNHLAQILSTLALIRTLNWLCRRLLYLLGLIKVNPDAEEAWQKAKTSPDSTTLPLDLNGLNRHRSSWPILMYFGVVLGAPWLIWKLLNSIAGINDTDANRWTTKDDDHYLAVALYEFQGEGPRELSLQAGKEIVLAPRNLQPKVKGWLLASSDGKNTGLVPANYIKILGFRRGLKHQSLIIPSQADSCNKKPKDCHDNNLARATPNEVQNVSQNDLVDFEEGSNHQNTNISSPTDFHNEKSEDCLDSLESANQDELQKISQNDESLN